LILLYVVVAFEVLVAIMIYGISRSLSSTSKKPSTILNYCLKMVSIFAVLLNTILLIPFLELFTSVFFCNKEDPVHGDLGCYQGIYYLDFAIALIGAFLLIGFLLIFLPFYIELNPFSKLPFASPRTNMPYFKLVMKVFLPVYFTIDFRGNLNVQFVVLSGIYWSAILLFRYQSLPYYNRSIFRFLLICESILFWAGGVANIHAVSYFLLCNPNKIFSFSMETQLIILAFFS
jgi:hypothetical protein